MYFPTIRRERLFRETEAVHFSDLSVEGSNGLDLVHHKGAAISPPLSEAGELQFYVHNHQTDNNRCLSGSRIFELVNFEWNIARWFIKLDASEGALEILPGVYHRSVSCAEGSILINQAVRDSEYDETQEFNPVTLRAIDLVGLRTGFLNCTYDEVSSTKGFQ